MAETQPQLTAPEVVRTIRGLCVYAHATARSRNLLGGTVNIGEELMLMATELSKAMWWVRRGKPLRDITTNSQGKPMGFPIKLADVMLRCFSLCGHLGVDLGEAIRIKAAYNARKRAS